MSQVNKNNFLRWDDGEDPASIESDLPNGYIRNSTACDYKPLLVAAEAMRFYINALDGLSFIPALEADDDHTLALVNAVTGVVQNASVAPLQPHSFIDGNGDTVRTYYAEVVIDGTVPAGDYIFKIMDGATLRLTSNTFTVVASTSNYTTYTALAEFRHDRYFYGINYQSLDGFYQQFRLHLNQVDTQPEQDREVYNEITTGKQRVYNNFMKRVKKVETYYFDKQAHEAAAIMFDHDELYLNLKRYITKAVYKENYDVLSKKWKGECELYLEEAATANRCIPGV